ncbi:MAG TPA: hypothetical protein VK956_20910 [Verrucomicrobium sp.]|nr:hypothetical protein [Verrucomicrobium sp.]
MMRLMPRPSAFTSSIACLAAALLLSHCATSSSPGAPGKIGPLAKVTRAETLAIADRYLNHQWHPTEANRMHGFDVDGQRVDTPDASFAPAGVTPGYWKPGLVNFGVPYCWGGHDTPEQFDNALKAGKYAGDIYTAQKRAGLEDAVSRHTTGVDCSGFVSRCWGLEWHCSTRTIPYICEKLPSYHDLLPGDVLNTVNGHVVLFAAFSKPDKSELLVYETGSPLGWRVTKHTVPVWFLKQQDYLPYRYKGIKG